MCARPDAGKEAGADSRGRTKEPSLLDALVPLATMVVLIGGALLLFGLDALDGPIQVALVLCAMVAALVATKNGHSWEDVQAAAQGLAGVDHQRDLHPAGRGRRMYVERTPR